MTGTRWPDVLRGSVVVEPPTGRQTPGFGVPIPATQDQPQAAVAPRRPSLPEQEAGARTPLGVLRPLTEPRAFWLLGALGSRIQLSRCGAHSTCRPKSAEAQSCPASRGARAA